MVETFYVLLPVFGIILIGFVAGRTRLLGASQDVLTSGFNSYVYYLCMPAFLFLAMSKVGGHLSGRYIAVYATSFFATAGFAAALSRYVFGRSRSALVLSIMAASYTNSAYLGVPVMQLAYGDLTPVVSVMAFQVGIISPLILTSLSLLVKAPHLAGDVRLTDSVWIKGLRGIRHAMYVAVMNPIIIGSALGMLSGALSLPIPAVLEELMKLLGGAGMPTALFVLGLSLNLPHTAEVNRIEIACLTFLSLVILPAGAFVAGKYLFNLEWTELRSVTVMAAMPTAMNTFIFAKRYEQFVHESAMLVMTTLVGSFFSLSVLLFFFGDK